MDTLFKTCQDLKTSARRPVSSTIRHTSNFCLAPKHPIVVGSELGEANTMIALECAICSNLGTNRSRGWSKGFHLIAGAEPDFCRYCVDRVLGELTSVYTERESQHLRNRHAVMVPLEHPRHTRQMITTLAVEAWPA